MTQYGKILTAEYPLVPALHPETQKLTKSNGDIRCANEKCDRIIKVGQPYGSKLDGMMGEIACTISYCVYCADDL